MKLLNFLSIGCCMLIAQNGISQGKFYVNDNSFIGDVFTTSFGSSTNSDTKADPLVTITAALSIAQAGDTIYIDAGTYAEQIIIDKGIVFIGAKKTLRNG